MKKILIALFILGIMAACDPIHIPGSGMYRADMCERVTTSRCVR